MKKMIPFVSMVLAVSAQAKSPFNHMNSNEAKKYFTITNVEVTEVTPDTFLSFNESLTPCESTDPFCDLGTGTGTVPTPPAGPNDPTKPGPTIPGPTDPTPLPPTTETPRTKIGEIIAIGEKVWQFIKDNRAVVTQRFGGVSIIPTNVKSWDEMEGWSEPKIKVYKVSFKNGLGMKPIEFAYRVTYTYGGNYQGIGKYISRIETEPSKIKTIWGYSLDASGEVLNIHNRGTRDNPIASAEIRINWTVSTVLKVMQDSTRFYLTGEGLYKDLSDGNIRLR